MLLDHLRAPCWATLVVKCCHRVVGPNKRLQVAHIPLAGHIWPIGHSFDTSCGQWGKKKDLTIFGGCYLLFCKMIISLHNDVTAAADCCTRL